MAEAATGVGQAGGVRAYMPHLDGLRAFAVVAVMARHWLPERWQFGLPLETGVQLFFVLSGFLITGILLDGRAGVGLRCNARVIRNFYVRRFLRIFPLYYLVVGLALWFGVPHLRETVWWHLGYASNFCFYWHAGYGTSIGHFWSLAVEEQFYLVWPFVILLVPAWRLWGVVLLLCLVGPLYRYAGGLWSGLGHFAVGTPGSFDSLALGAGLALGLRLRPAWFGWWVRWRWVLAWVAVAGFVVVDQWGAVSWAVGQGLSLFLISVLYVVLIHDGSLGFRGVVGRLFDLRVVRYVGKISYGLYVLHNFAGLVTMPLLRAFPLLGNVPGSVLVINALLTFAAAALSWHFYESRMNALKHRFA